MLPSQCINYKDQIGSYAGSYPLSGKILRSKKHEKKVLTLT